MHQGCENYRQFNRRDFLRVGGAGLFGLTFADFFRAQASGQERRARSMILIWLAGGPPHQDMFDMKPETPLPFGSELRPTRTNVAGIEFCELMPRLAQMADKFSILRSVGIGNERWEHSGGLYWLTGNPRNQTTVRFPMYGSVVAKERPAQPGLPSFVAFGTYRESGDLHHNYLGPAHDPMIFQPGDPRDEVGAMLVPPAHLDLSEMQRRENLLQSLDTQVRRLDASEHLIAGMDRFQQSAFDMLRSPRLRQAVDPRLFPPRLRDRYGRNPQGTSALAACRLVDAGVPFVFVPWNGWDYHGSVTNACRTSLPILDAMVSSLLQDLHDRGLLETTIVTVLGEMGRNRIYQDPAYSGPPGRDHWGTTQFVLVAGGGFRQGMVLGATDRTSVRVIDKYYSPVSYGRTLYHLLGIDPEKELFTASGRPVRIISEDAPLIREIV
ncbi:MAG: DUF1501 domain-containing protein [Planctomycetes bacterium]|nr:DUF1501 domain-containing protein [Planctomycetota bacterium]